jgi:hypothetical protein
VANTIIRKDSRLAVHAMHALDPGLTVGAMINTYGGVVRRPKPTLCSHKTTANYV